MVPKGRKLRRDDEEELKQKIKGTRNSLVEKMKQRNIDGPGPAWPGGPDLEKTMMSQPEVERTSSTHRESDLGINKSRLSSLVVNHKKETDNLNCPRFSKPSFPCSDIRFNQESLESEIPESLKT